MTIRVGLQHGHDFLFVCHSFFQRDEVMPQSGAVKFYPGSILADSHRGGIQRLNDQPRRFI